MLEDHSEGQGTTRSHPLIEIMIHDLTRPAGWHLHPFRMTHPNLVLC